MTRRMGRILRASAILLNALTIDYEEKIDNSDTGVIYYVAGFISKSLMRQEKDKSYAGIIEVLMIHLKPTPITIAERFKFYERAQLPGERVNDFIAALRTLALKCEFAAFLEEAIRDKLVYGTSNSRIRKRLLVERDLTLKKAIEIANALEVVEIDNQIMDSAVEIKSKDTNLLAFNKYKEKPKCYRCSSEDHLANTCRFKDIMCNKCHRRGHIAKACRTRRQSTDGKRMAVNHISPTDRSIDVHNDYNSGDDVIHIHAFTGLTSPYSIELFINGTLMTFEIDTGSGVSIISEETYYKHFSRINSRIRTYTNEQVNVLGKILVDVKIKNKFYKQSRQLVLKGSGVNLLGRDWLLYMDVDWSAIYNASKTSDKLLTAQFAHELNTTVEKNKSEAITKRLIAALENYKSIFNDRIGSIRGYKAKIHVKPDVVPVFKKKHVLFLLHYRMLWIPNWKSWNKLELSSRYHSRNGRVLSLSSPNRTVAYAFAEILNKPSTRTLKQKCIQHPVTKEYLQNCKVVKLFRKLIYDKHIYNWNWTMNPRR